MTFFPPLILAYIFCASIYPFEYTPHLYSKCVNDYIDCAKTMPGAKCIEEMEKQHCERGMLQ